MVEGEGAQTFPANVGASSSEAGADIPVVNCPRCNGKGKVPVQHPGLIIWVLCPQCHGQCVVYCCNGENYLVPMEARDE